MVPKTMAKRDWDEKEVIIKFDAERSIEGCLLSNLFQVSFPSSDYVQLFVVDDRAIILHSLFHS